MAIDQIVQDDIGQFAPPITPAERGYTTHRSGITAADTDEDGIGTVNHTECTKTQVLAVCDGITNCTLVAEVERTEDGTDFCRTQSYTVSRSTVLFFEHGGGWVRVRVTALTGASPSVNIYVKKV